LKINYHIASCNLPSKGILAAFFIQSVSSELISSSSKPFFLRPIRFASLVPKFRPDQSEQSNIGPKLTCDRFKQKVSRPRYF